MDKQMAWLSATPEGTKTLHLRQGSRWRPYTCFPGIAVPDYPIPGGSKGWATYQRLLKQGWQLIPTATVEAEIIDLAS